MTYKLAPHVTEEMLKEAGVWYKRMKGVRI